MPQRLVWIGPCDVIRSSTTFSSTKSPLLYRNMLFTTDSDAGPLELRDGWRCLVLVLQQLSGTEAADSDPEKFELAADHLPTLIA